MRRPPVFSKEALDFVEGPAGCEVKIPPIEVRLDSVAAGTLFIFGDEVETTFNLPQQACKLPGLGSCPDFDDDDDSVEL
jgi:hypothetical protein